MCLCTYLNWKKLTPKRCSEKWSRPSISSGLQSFSYWHGRCQINLHQTLPHAQLHPQPRSLSQMMTTCPRHPDQTILPTANGLNLIPDPDLSKPDPNLGHSPNSLRRVGCFENREEHETEVCSRNDFSEPRFLNAWDISADRPFDAVCDCLRN